MRDLATLTIVEAATALRAGSLSAKALLDAYLGYCQGKVGVQTNPGRQWFQAAI